MNAATLRLLLIGGLVVAVLFGGAKLVSAVRGIRNNNPGNIELGDESWQGAVPIDQQTDDRFVQFISPEYGIRAMAKILDSYARRGIVTIADIISTWAPPNENDTSAYIRAVIADLFGVDAHTPIYRAQWPGLIAAIIHYENGIQPYDSSTLARGVALA